MPHPLFTAFLEQHKLPADYLAEADKHFAPVIRHIHRELEHNHPVVVGINGSQGSGKTTTAAWLETALSIAGLKVVSISLDDFYLPHAARLALGEAVHPLLATRGVPSTHDVPLALKTLAALKNGEPVAIPRFDKAHDDRVAQGRWDRVNHPVDVVILEGWCMGATAEADDALDKPVNTLEATEDANGLWRRYVNRALRDDYPPLFASVDIWVMLCAPGFETVFAWRWEQEQKLAKKLQNNNPDSNSAYDGLMSKQQVTRFVGFFQRLTGHMLKTLPAQVDHCYSLNKERQIIDETHRA